MTTKEIIEMLRVCADDDIICPACPRYEQCEYGGTAECYERLMLEAADALESALGEQEKRRWIPVTERLPDEHESLFARFKDTDKWSNGMFMSISDLVIVCAERENGERVVKIANTVDGVWKVKDSFYPCNVTHWMPLPEPPKED